MEILVENLKKEMM
jgi:hypothetical protein